MKKIFIQHNLKIMLGIGLLALYLGVLELESVRLDHSVTKSPNNIQPSQKKVENRDPHSVGPVPSLQNQNSVATVSPHKEVQFNLKPEEIFQLKQDLKTYSVIKSKVYSDTEEQRDRERVINDTRLLESAGHFLKSTDALKSDHDRELQNSAIDLLMEAYEKGDRSTAWDSILSVIKDPQVENSQLDSDLRVVIAGIKGELMYHVTALTPQFKETIEQTMAGPISNSIWKNVQQRQNRNYSESLAEKEIHERSATR